MNSAQMDDFSVWLTKYNGYAINERTRETVFVHKNCYENILRRINFTRFYWCSIYSLPKSVSSLQIFV